MIALGVVAEYLLTMNEFDSAVIFHEKYVEAIKGLKKTKNLKMKERSFN